MMDKWLTFDCYGTLVDWRSGMIDALRSVAGDDADGLLTAYHRYEPVVQTENPTWSYRAVLREGVRRAALACAIDLDAEQSDVLGRTLTLWPVFPDTEHALRELRDCGYRLAILSNVDRELLDQTIAGLGVPFDEVVTSSEIGSFKPAAPHFDTFAERTGGDHDSWIHVACSWYHDVIPADRRGVRSVFVNREHSAEGPAPATAVLDDLEDLPATVDRLFGRAARD
ncbi:HAD-IA family hydrolase [Tsukamurella tyrosinosolvens]|uniref:HAD-IA family hydrolase n=1 Tax=Tsukamurella tyrosinosolvens TaxID=57704 RepID=UPI002DD436F0|nr:HAD-IA family hydrolase [Tsukamurella tyrosinosolvens]MEC4612986.1 HAD-IA family hydrolase [Tsukamurella tyrosinosolvens]